MGVANVSKMYVTSMSTTTEREQGVVASQTIGGEGVQSNRGVPGVTYDLPLISCDIEISVPVALLQPQDPPRQFHHLTSYKHAAK